MKHAQMRSPFCFLLFFFSFFFLSFFIVLFRSSLLFEGFLIARLRFIRESVSYTSILDSFSIVTAPRCCLCSSSLLLLFFLTPDIFSHFWSLFFLARASFNAGPVDGWSLFVFRYAKLLSLFLEGSTNYGIDHRA